MRIEVVQPTQAHVEQLAATMMPADAEECRALGAEPLDAAMVSWRASHLATALLFDGGVAAIGGLCLEVPTSALAPRRAGVWLLTTTRLELAPMALHRLAKRWLLQAAGVADVVWNHVDSRHAPALRWLSALGFTIRPDAIESSGVSFHLVFRRL